MPPKPTSNNPKAVAAKSKKPSVKSNKKTEKKDNYTSDDKKIIKKYETQIVEKLNENNVKSMYYGGQTTKTMNDRLKEHKNDSSEYNGSKIRLILGKVEKKYVKDLENFLVNELYKKYGKNKDIKCMNAKNKDGTPSQHGGAGMVPEYNGTYKLYLAYK